MKTLKKEELRRLLESAAKAIGGVHQDSAKRVGVELVMHETASFPFWMVDGRHDSQWKPHLDDGDSRQLEVELGITVTPYPIYSMPKHSVITEQKRIADQDSQPNPTRAIELYGDDPAAATRLAILRTAAAIGNAIPHQGETS